MTCNFRSYKTCNCSIFTGCIVLGCISWSNQNLYSNHSTATHLVVTSHIGHAAKFTSQLVLDAVDAVVVDVDGADKHVVGDVIQVTAELEPGPGSADVVCRALALDLEESKGKRYHPTQI